MIVTPSLRKDPLYVDFPEFNEIDERVREENAKQVFVGGVRINISKYRTKAEDEEYRRKSLKRKLP